MGGRALRLAAMTEPVVSSTIIVYREPHAYSSHPSITRLRNGDWLVAFSHSTQRAFPILHPPNDPQFVNLVIRSRDEGLSWEQPKVAPGYDWYGVETPGISSSSTGEVLLNQWRFKWAPLETAKKRWVSGDNTWFIADRDTRIWRLARSEQDWASHPLPYARGDDGAYVHISTDDGSTWDRTIAIDIAPYQGAFSPKGVVELRNGDLLLALGSHDHDPLSATFVVRSRDRGRSWEQPVEVARADGRVFSEPSLVETASGRLLLMSREETSGHLHQSTSHDGGATWTPPRRLPMWGYPAHVISLVDGRVLMAYGHRRHPFGIRAVLTDDDGETWSPEIVIRDDVPGTYRGLNLGYPSVIEYLPGRLFAVYYGEDREGVTCVQGTYFALDPAAASTADHAVTRRPERSRRAIAVDERVHPTSPLGVRAGLAVP